MGLLRRRTSPLEPTARFQPMGTGLHHEHMLNKIFFLRKLHSNLEYRWQ